MSMTMPGLPYDETERCAIDLALATLHRFQGRHGRFPHSLVVPTWWVDKFGDGWRTRVDRIGTLCGVPMYYANDIAGLVCVKREAVELHRYQRIFLDRIRQGDPLTLKYLW